MFSLLYSVNFNETIEEMFIWKIWWHRYLNWRDGRRVKLSLEWTQEKISTMIYQGRLCVKRGEVNRDLFMSLRIRVSKLWKTQGLIARTWTSRGKTLRHPVKACGKAFEGLKDRYIIDQKWFVSIFRWSCWINPEEKKRNTENEEEKLVKWNYYLSR